MAGIMELAERFVAAVEKIAANGDVFVAMTKIAYDSDPATATAQ